MNLQLVYRHISSLSENEKMSKTKQNKIKQTDQTIAPRQLMLTATFTREESIMIQKQ